jgi:hypothetical protein
VRNTELRLFDPVAQGLRGWGFFPAQYISSVGLIVIRTVWIAAFCLACLGGLFATRVTASNSEEVVRDPVTVGTSLTKDTLSKADRLEVTYLPLPAESIPAPPIEPVAAEPVVAEVVAAEPAATTKAGASYRAGLNKHRTTILLPKPRPKIRPPRNAKDASLAKPADDLKTCHQQGGLGGALISLGGFPRCAS